MIRFVTGTGVGVGKTVVATVLARADRASGRIVGYVKAVQTGVEPGQPGDLDFVREAAGVPAQEGLRFPGRLDPALAAEQSRSSIGIDWLVDRIQRQAGMVDVLYVEGTGGLLAPLSGDLTMADLAIRLGAEVVVVTRPGLGTVNLTALTLEAARTRSLQLSGLVVNRWPAHPGVLERTSLERLGRMAPVLGVLPLVEDLSTRGPAPLPDGFAFLAPDSVAG